MFNNVVNRVEGVIVDVLSEFDWEHQTVELK